MNELDLKIEFNNYSMDKRHCIYLSGDMVQIMKSLDTHTKSALFKYECSVYIEVRSSKGFMMLASEWFDWPVIEGEFRSSLLCVRRELVEYFESFEEGNLCYKNSVED